jgi:hypothetical protein
VKRVLNKRGLILQLKEKAQNMDIGVQIFFSKIEALQKKGLPSLFFLNDKLMICQIISKRFPPWTKTVPSFQGYKETS